MASISVDFGRATFTHAKAQHQLSCSAFGTVQGEPEVIGTDVSINAISFARQRLWIRCSTPISFGLSFCFDSFTIHSPRDRSSIKQAIATAIDSSVVSPPSLPQVRH